MRTLAITWLWSQPNGRTTYTAAHVNIWRDMIAKHTTADCEFACVTDMPDGIDERIRIIPPPRDFEDVSIPSWKAGRPQCFRRLAMFRPDAADLFGADRLLSIDLDVVVTGPLDPLFECRDDFRIAAGTGGGRPYNGSAMLIRCGARTKVYTEFNPQRAIQAGRRFAGSDQAWLMHILGPRERTWRPVDGVACWMMRHQAKVPRLLTFPGATKPWQLALTGERTVAEHYRRSPVGRGLVLGYGPTLWADVAAVADQEFAAVIASPEAAPHWPGPVLAIAEDDEHAARLAAMHGLEPVFCGRGELHAVAA